MPHTCMLATGRNAKRCTECSTFMHSFVSIFSLVFRCYPRFASRKRNEKKNGLESGRAWRAEVVQPKALHLAAAACAATTLFSYSIRFFPVAASLARTNGRIKCKPEHVPRRQRNWRYALHRKSNEQKVACRDVNGIAIPRSRRTNCVIGIMFCCCRRRWRCHVKNRVVTSQTDGGRLQQVKIYMFWIDMNVLTNTPPPPPPPRSPQKRGTWKLQNSIHCSITLLKFAAPFIGPPTDWLICRAGESRRWVRI